MPGQISIELSDDDETDEDTDDEEMGALVAVSTANAELQLQDVHLRRLAQLKMKAAAARQHAEAAAAAKSATPLRRPAAAAIIFSVEKLHAEAEAEDAEEIGAEMEAAEALQLRRMELGAVGLEALEGEVGGADGGAVAPEAGESSATVEAAVDVRAAPGISPWLPPAAPPAEPPAAPPAAAAPSSLLFQPRNHNRSLRHRQHHHMIAGGLSMLEVGGEAHQYNAPSSALLRREHRNATVCPPMPFTVKMFELLSSSGPRLLGTWGLLLLVTLAFSDRLQGFRNSDFAQLYSSNEVILKTVSNVCGMLPWLLVPFLVPSFKRVMKPGGSLDALGLTTEMISLSDHKLLINWQRAMKAWVMLTVAAALTVNLFLLFAEDCCGGKISSSDAPTTFPTSVKAAQELQRKQMGWEEKTSGDKNITQLSAVCCALPAINCTASGKVGADGSYIYAKADDPSWKCRIVDAYHVQQQSNDVPFMVGLKLLVISCVLTPIIFSWWYTLKVAGVLSNDAIEEVIISIDETQPADALDSKWQLEVARPLQRLIRVTFPALNSWTDGLVLLFLSFLTLSVSSFAALAFDPTDVFAMVFVVFTVGVAVWVASDVGEASTKCLKILDALNEKRVGLVSETSSSQDGHYQLELLETMIKRLNRGQGMGVAPLGFLIDRRVLKVVAAKLLSFYGLAYVFLQGFRTASGGSGDASALSNATACQLRCYQEFFN